MRDLLIRYLLGEMDAEEQRALQSQLRASPELRQELAQLRACFAAHQNDELDAVPPRDLAARTAERVIDCDGESDLLTVRDASQFSSGGDTPPGILGWSLADLTVAGGVMLAVSMLIFPALRASRDGTRLDQCANKMHQMFLSEAAFAENNAGFAPKIGPREHAGAFVIQLIARGFADPKDFADWLVCPDSPMADKIRFEGLVYQVPSAEAIKAMSASQLEEFAATASPCFAYSLPHRVGHQLRYVRIDHDRFTPIFSDTPGKSASSSMTPNHGSRYIQIHFADGSVRLFTSWKLPFDDDLSHNDLGFVAAGMRPHDIVMGGSDATPGDDLLSDGK